MAGQPAAVRKGIRILVGVTLGLAVLAPLTGCSQPDDGIPAAEKKNAERFDAIAKASGGDWEKLSQTDKDYIVKELAHGNEDSAKMLLAAKSGRLRDSVGTPQVGGPGGSSRRLSGSKP